MHFGLSVQHEHQIPNLGVTGSNPVGVTREITSKINKLIPLMRYRHAH